MSFPNQQQGYFTSKSVQDPNGEQRQIDLRLPYPRHASQASSHNGGHVLRHDRMPSFDMDSRRSYTSSTPTLKALRHKDSATSLPDQYGFPQMKPPGSSTAMSGSASPTKSDLHPRSPDEEPVPQPAPESSASHTQERPGSEKALEDLTKPDQNGEQPPMEPSTFHKYKIHFMDLATGKEPKKQLASALFEHVVDKHSMFPERSTPSSNRHIRVTTDHVRIEEGGARLEDRVISIKMREFDDQDAEAKTNIEEYVPVTTGRKKSSLKWVRFDEPRDFKKPKVLSANELEHAVRRVQDLACREFVMWVEREEVTLTDDAYIVYRTGSEKQVFDDAVSTFVGQYLFGRLVDKKYKVPEQDIIVRGNRVYFHQTSTDHGLREIQGLQGKVCYDINGEPHLAATQCKARFFQELLVSEFLFEFFGPTAIAGLDGEALSRASKMLTGVSVVVAGSKNRPTKVAMIAGLNNGKNSQSNLGETSLASLKHPNLPCVNIGSQGKPVYYPAELCKIHTTSQQFSGQLPLPMPENAFSLQPAEKPKEDTTFVPKSGDPFAGQKTDGFQLVFVNITAEDLSGNYEAMSSEVGASFRKEIGRRFNGKLKNAVEESIYTTVQYQDFLEVPLSARIRELVHQKPGVKTVLVVAVPENLPVKAIDRIRLQCDVVWGVQCCIINGNQVTERYHPIKNEEMVKYTGQIVRKIFARAAIPAQSNDVQQDNTPVTSNGSTPGRLVGIHVTQMREFRENDKFGQRSVQNDCCLINVVSIAMEQNSKDIHATEHVVDKSSEDDGLNGGIMDALESHLLADRKNQALPLRIFISGVEDEQATLMRLRTYLDKVSPNFPDCQNAVNSAQRHIDAQSRQFGEPGTSVDFSAGLSYTLTAVAPEHRFSLHVPNENLALDTPKVSLAERNNARTHFSETALDADRTFHNEVVSKVFKYEPRPIPNVAQANEHPHMTTWRLTCLRSDFSIMLRNSPTDGSDQAFVAHPSHARLLSLDTHALPAILHLAQKAAQRSRLHVYLKNADKDTRLPMVPYGLRPIHGNLNHTLYFL